MLIAHTIAESRQALASMSRSAFVPTLGNLHDGHLSLVKLAREHGGPVVASIFVNRRQFAPHEDFAPCPRTHERDCERLRSMGRLYVFAPDEAEFCPQPRTCKLQPPDELAETLEGQFRPGLIAGVCTVLLKLFRQPDHMAIRRQADTAAAASDRVIADALAVPAAAKLGATRLIDNLEIAAGA